MDVKLDSLSHCRNYSSKDSGLPYWIKKCYLVRFKIIETSKWSKIWRSISGGADSYLYFLRPIGKGKWKIYTYGSDHYRAQPYAHYLGDIQGSNKPEVIARDIPMLHKRPFRIIEE